MTIVKKSSSTDRLSSLGGLAALCLLILVSISCKSTYRKPDLVVNQEIKNEQEAEVKEAIRAFDEGDFKLAEQKYQEFLTHNPVTLFTTQAKYGWARSIEEQGRAAEALAIYRDLAEQARLTAPDFAGLAYFRQSYCYEALGDEVRVASSLADATTFAKALSKEIIEIEIPARKAASWMRRGDVAKAKIELSKVDRAFPGIFPPNDQTSLKDQARILFSAGDLSLEPLKPDTFMSLIQTHEELQNYLWRASQTKVAPYAERARKKLTERYGKFMALAMSYTNPSKREQDENRQKWMAAVLKSLQTLKNFTGDDWGAAPQDLIAALLTVEMQANQTLWGVQDATPLTPEAKSRSSKRRGRVVSKPFFPNEKAQEKKDSQE